MPREIRCLYCSAVFPLPARLEKLYLPCPQCQVNIRNPRPYKPMLAEYLKVMGILFICISLCYGLLLLGKGADALTRRMSGSMPFPRLNAPNPFDIVVIGLLCCGSLLVSGIAFCWASARPEGRAAKALAGLLALVLSFSVLLTFGDLLSRAFYP
jgi:hypothetical protein